MELEEFRNSGKKDLLQEYIKIKEDGIAGITESNFLFSWIKSWL